MKKSEAIRLLGGTVTDAARKCRISSAAVSQWPEELSQDIVDRVQAALYRDLQEPKGRKTPKRATAAAAEATTYSGPDRRDPESKKFWVLPPRRRGTDKPSGSDK